MLLPGGKSEAWRPTSSTHRCLTSLDNILAVCCVQVEDLVHDLPLTVDFEQRE